MDDESNAVKMVKYKGFQVYSNTSKAVKKVLKRLRRDGIVIYRSFAFSETKQVASDLHSLAMHNNTTWACIAGGDLLILMTNKFREKHIYDGVKKLEKCITPNLEV